MHWFRRKRDLSSPAWAVVQDLRPFGYRIECTHKTQAGARQCLGWSRYLTVKPLEWVHAENERLRDKDEFDRELRRSVIRRCKD